MVRQSGHFHDGPDFDGPVLGGGNPRGDREGVVEVRGINEKIPAKVLARLGERSVGDEAIAVAKQIPMAANGTVEVRPVIDFP